MIDPRLTSQYEDEILELIDNQDEFTRSDLQGVVTVLVQKLCELGTRYYQKKKRGSSLGCFPRIRPDSPSY